MIHAYAETYLYDAMRNLGEAVDYAVNECGIEIDDFAYMFVTSGYAGQFQSGNPKYVAGMSGTELAMDIITKVGLKIDFPEAQVAYDCSPEYWCGWILAYYQWEICRSFKHIFETLPMSDILRLYGTLHEASEEKFVDTANAIRERKRTCTRLQRQRKHRGLSQRELSERSGVNLRTLQQYELGTKDIRKAALETVLALVTVLGCSIDDIVE